MGNIIARIWSLFDSHVQHKILMVGLDAAGKTTLLYRMKLGEVVTTIPTIGFNVETIKYKNISFDVWDLCGQDRIRALAIHYYPTTTGIILVLDSCDVERLPDVKEQLERLSLATELIDVPFLILCNKQDLPHSLTMAEITDKLSLNYILRNRRWYCQSIVALTLEGVYEGFDWLANELRTNPPK
ncbi:hypothetical protein SAMD00019534_005310, partial [Acytostelium subglobosum LB1]|uniref:hypothetical protein n=1 Tax=Acytostelium subglobosum LB1 TaxID=1410327 RepID=UPI0006450F04